MVCCQREPDLPFSVLELNEVFTDEPAGKPDMRLIVNNDLIGLGYGKYEQIYRLSDVAVDKPLWLPDSKDELFEFHIDRFYLSEEGKKMAEFLSDLKSDGVFKMLSDFVFYTHLEQFEIDYYKSESKKETLRQLFKETALKKLLDYIRMNLQIGNHFYNSVADDLDYTLKFMEEELGVTLTEKQLEQFIELFTNLNNRSHLWQNCGWKPDDLFRGANLQNLFDSGELDRDEFEEGLRQMGIELIQ